jgi:hypothetical protein
MTQRFEQIYADHHEAVRAYVRRRAPDRLVDQVPLAHEREDLRLSQCSGMTPELGAVAAAVPPVQRGANREGGNK